jgi:hypothetical protein
MAEPSFFPEMKSANPAVISSRRGGQHTLSGNILKIKKDMTLSQTKGAPFDGSAAADVTLTNASYFRGGKGGDFTTEFYAETVSGTRTDTTRNTTTVGTDADNNIKSKASSTYFNIGLGFGSLFGISIGKAQYTYNASNSQTIAGITYGFTGKTNLNYLSIKPGTSFDFLGLRWGACMDMITATGNFNSTFTRTGMSPEVSSLPSGDGKSIIGLAVSYSSAMTHLELSREFPTGNNPSNDGTSSSLSTPPSPSRTSGTIEFDFGDIKFGYKANYYQNSFFDLEKIISSKMLYKNMDNTSRLENIINFAMGSSQGFSFGASVSYSKVASNEKPDFITATQNQSTNTVSKGASVKLGYSF